MLVNSLYKRLNSDAYKNSTPSSEQAQLKDLLNELNIKEKKEEAAFETKDNR